MTAPDDTFVPDRLYWYLEGQSRCDKSQIRVALRALATDQRLAVVLFHQEGLTYDEISEETGWPLGTVKTNLYRGRKEMGRRLKALAGGDLGL